MTRKWDMARKKKELTLVAAARPQLKKQAKRDWSKAKAARFLSVLAETCNVSEALRQSGGPLSVAYRRRKMDAGFRAAWAEALGVAYARLEMMLLERAFNGTEKVVRRKDGSEEMMRDYSDKLGLTLLRMHRDAAIEADSEMAPADVDEIRERLVRKLQRLKKRDEEQEAGAVGAPGDAPRDGDPKTSERGESAQNHS
jgi:hypothetical protein